MEVVGRINCHTPLIRVSPFIFTTMHIWGVNFKFLFFVPSQCNDFKDGT